MNVSPGPAAPAAERFAAVLPEDVQWKPFAAFPPAAQLAVMVGDPTKPGLYTTRVKCPSGVKLMPHVAPEPARLSRAFAPAQSVRVSPGRAGNASIRPRREVMPSLVNTLRRCHSTVRGLRNSWAPISGLVRPSRASRAISSS
jgi:hypothetical protein